MDVVMVDGEEEDDEEDEAGPCFECPPLFPRCDCEVEEEGMGVEME